MPGRHQHCSRRFRGGVGSGGGRFRRASFARRLETLRQRWGCASGHRRTAPGAGRPPDRGGGSMSAPKFETPDVSHVANSRTVSWYEASARQRVRLMLDAGSFQEFIGPEQREESPHLRVFDLPTQFDDGIIVGRGRISMGQVVLSPHEGRFMGGAFGEVHGAKLTDLLRAARDSKSMPVLILFDTGGVRPQGANAGGLAIAQIMRALSRARTGGVEIVGLIGGPGGRLRA